MTNQATEPNIVFFQHSIQWNKTQNAEFPYRVTVDNQAWVIRINDFPEEELYTLIIDSEEMCDFSGWPNNWVR